MARSEEQITLDLREAWRGGGGGRRSPSPTLGVEMT